MTQTLQTMTGGEAVVAALKAQGLDTLYGLPGLQLDPLFNALHGARDWLRVVNARHEQGVAYMALGHAQATGRPGVYACVPGPGFLNTGAALATAFAVHAPVLALVAQIASPDIGLGGGELHEIDGQSAMVGALTRWSATARRVEEIPQLIETAFAKLAAGIAPVAIELPADVLAASAPVSPPRRGLPPPPREPDPARLAEAAELLRSARAPMIVAGSGAYGAEASLRALAHRLGAPVMTYLQGRGLLRSDDPWEIGQLDGAALWPETDVILAVGTRFHSAARRRGLRHDQQLIRIDTDPAQFAAHPPQVALEADAGRSLAALLTALGAGAPAPGRAAAVAQAKAAASARFDTELAPQMAYLRVLAKHLPEGSHIVADYTQIAYVATARYPLTAPRQMLTPGYQGTLGWAYATALGAQLADPGRRSVALCGDGGFLFTAPEMATAVLHVIPLIGIVFTDGAYGNVQRMQDALYGGKVIATTLANPDFMRLADSFGVRARRAEGPEGLSAALDWALAETGPVVSTQRYLLRLSR